MAAALLQQTLLAGGDHGGTEIEAADRARRALGDAVGEPSTTTGRWCRSTSRLATMPTTPGCQPLTGRHQHRQPARELRLDRALRSVQQAALHRLPLAR